MDSVTFVFYVLYCLATGIPAFRLTLKSKPKLKQEYAKAQEIYSYFQKNIPILTSFDEDRHENLGATTKKANDRDAALFDVYMEAYKSNADAIILNSNDMTGSVGVADVQMGMGTALNVTQNGYNILATLVKYK